MKYYKKDCQLVIMAAGIGSRFGGLKQLAPIGPNNQTIIHYSLNDAIKAGFKNVLFIIRREIESIFRKIIEPDYKQKINIEYIFQDIDKYTYDFEIASNRSKPWGTGHAILAAKEAIDSDFVVINADDYYGSNAYKIIYEFIRSKISEDEFAMVGYKIANTLSNYGGVSRGICKITEDMYLKRINELKQVKKINDKIECLDPERGVRELRVDEITSMNFWAFTPLIFRHLEKKFRQFLSKYATDVDAEFYLPRVVNELIEEGVITVKVFLTDDKWFGITYVEDIEESPFKAK